MVSGAEIRRAVREERQGRRRKFAQTGAIIMAIGLALFPNKNPVVVGIALGFMLLLLIFSVFQLAWIAEATPEFTKIVRAAVGIVVSMVLIGAYGVIVWPPHHRHELSVKEQAIFEKPLKQFQKPQMSIHLYCAPQDEVNCEYAASLIPLFGRAEWDVANVVERITLGKPKAGILIGMHGNISPEDEAKMKWNQGEWTLTREEEWAVRQAFVNIGIEPDSISGAIVPQNQINIYVGHEREDESAPTLMTQEFENWKAMKRERPEMDKPAGAK